MLLCVAGNAYGSSTGVNRTQDCLQRLPLFRMWSRYFDFQLVNSVYFYMYQLVNSVFFYMCSLVKNVYLYICQLVYMCLNS